MEELARLYEAIATYARRELAADDRRRETRMSGAQVMKVLLGLRDEALGTTPTGPQSQMLDMAQGVRQMHEDFERKFDAELDAIGAVVRLQEEKAELFRRLDETLSR